ncbi:hypothetical protein MTR_8g465110 [Medicago truncatula]|uniref:Tf2-1-like SH3-like domain-containing protein n=1 Tax=Medicago truncatula TaxID=3880 RepID=A0A072TQW4_MEDTR|nr:hypothetical protein MTR_8g465110 [Medicago truncatula]
MTMMHGHTSIDSIMRRPKWLTEEELRDQNETKNENRVVTNPVTGVGRALKCRKSTPHFVGPFDVVEKVGVVAYQNALPSSLSNLHDMFHVSQLRKYVYDASHAIQVDELEVRDNLTVETWPVWIEDREVKRLHDKEIVLVKNYDCSLKRTSIVSYGSCSLKRTISEHLLVATGTCSLKRTRWSLKRTCLVSATFDFCSGS